MSTYLLYLLLGLVVFALLFLLNARLERV